MKNIIKIHDVAKWFPEGLRIYFETSFKMNKIGSFKAPASVKKRFNNFQTYSDVDAFVDAFGNSTIQAIIAHNDGTILQSIEWEWLLPETREQLRTSVADALQVAMLNPQIINEHFASSGVSSPNWSVSNPISGFVLNSDVLGKLTKMAIQNAKLENYHFEGDSFIGRMYYDGTDTIVLQEWDNTFLGKNLGDNLISIEEYIKNFAATTTIDKYDFITVRLGENDEEKWRFEGKDATDIANWNRVDVIQVAGKKYLMYDQIVLTGTKGETGVLIFKGSIADKTTLDALSRPKLNWTYITLDTNKMYVYDGSQWVFAADIPAGLMGKPGKDGQSIYFRAPVANAAALPTAGNVLNDVRITSDDKHWHGWNGNAWIDFGEITIEYTFKDGSSVADQDRAITTEEFTILTTLLNGGTLNDVLTWDGTNVIWKAPTGTATSSGIETVSAFADIDATKLNKIYTVIDMDGVFTLEGYFFEKGEKGIVVVDSTGITSIYATPQQMWKEIVAIKTRLDAIEAKANAIQIVVDEHDNILKAIENIYTDPMGTKIKLPTPAGGYATLDISTTTGSEGLFDYTKGKKISIQIGMPYEDLGYDIKTLTVGDPATAYSITSADGTKTATFRMEVNNVGGLDFRNISTSGITFQQLGIVSIEQNANVATTTGTPQDLSKYALKEDIFSDEAYMLMGTSGQNTGVLRKMFFDENLFDKAAPIPTVSSDNPAGLVAGHQFAGSKFNIYSGLFSAFKEVRTPGQTMTIRIIDGDILSIGYIFYSGALGNVQVKAFRVVPTDAVVNSVGLELRFSKPDDTHSSVSMSPHANYKLQEAELPLGPTITTDTVPTTWVDVPGNVITVEDSDIFFNGDRDKNWQKFFYDSRVDITGKTKSDQMMEITIQQAPEDAINTLKDEIVELNKNGGGTTPGTGSANFGDGNPTTDQPRALTQAEIDSIGTGGGGTGVANFGDGAATTTQSKAVSDADFNNIDDVQNKMTNADMVIITGMLANLLTSNKGNLVNAINEMVGQIASVVAGVTFKDVYPSTAARDAALPTPTAGTIAIITGGAVDDIEIYNGTAWVPIKLPQIKVGPFDYEVDPGDTIPTPAVGETTAFYDDPTLDGTFSNKIVGVNLVGELEPIDKDNIIGDGTLSESKLNAAVVNKLDKTISLKLTPYTEGGHATTEGLWRVDENSIDWKILKAEVEANAVDVGSAFAGGTWTLQLRGEENNADMRAAATFGIGIGGDGIAVGAGTAAALMFTGGKWQTQIKVIGLSWDWSGSTLLPYMAIKATGETNNVWVPLLDSPVYSNPTQPSWHLKTRSVVLTITRRD